MTTTVPATERDSVQSSLLQRAQIDSDFRTLLMSDPHAAIKTLMGFDPIPALNIRVIEEQPGEVVLVLPRQLQEDELADEVLDLAVGGGTGYLTVVGGPEPKWHATNNAQLLTGGSPGMVPQTYNGNKLTKLWGECEGGHLVWYAAYDAKA